MSTTIDKKIVEMRFNNADFERNAAKSMSTVDKLKKSLKFDDSSDALNRIAGSVEALERRFSTLGVVSKRALENITDSVMHLGSKFTNFVTSTVKNGGITRAMNLENARFTMQGLLKDEKQVEAVMENVSASVDGTAYSLDQAATIASQFVSSGMRGGSRLERALKGVAGAAAVTNSDYSSMGRIFAQVSGQGRLMGNDLLQLSTRGMNAAATLKDFFNNVNSGADSIKDVSDDVQNAVKSLTGGAQITESDLRDLVSKGKISFDIFAEAMNNAFGDQAAKANDTLTGSFANIKAALGRIGAEFISPLIEQKGPLVNMFNTIREKVNDLKKVLTVSDDVKNYIAPSAAFVHVVTLAIENLTEKISKLNMSNLVRGVQNVLNIIQNLYVHIRNIVRPIRQAFKEIFPSPSLLKSVTDLTERFAQFTARIRMSKETTDKVRRTFRGLFALIDIGRTMLKSFIQILGPDFAHGIKMAVNYTLDLTARLGDFIVLVRNWLKESGTFDRVFTTIHNGLSGLISFLKPIGKTIGSVFEYVADKLGKFVETFAKADFGSAIKELFTSLGHDIVNGWKKPFIAVDRWLSNFHFYNTVKEFLTNLKDSVANSKVFQFILDAFTRLKDGVASIIDSFRNIDLGGADDMGNKLKGKFAWVDKIATFFKKVGNAIVIAGTWIWDAIKTAGTWIWDALTNSEFSKAINQLVSNSDLGDVGGLAAGLAAAFTGKKLWDVLDKADKIFKDFSGAFKGVNEILQKLGDVLHAFSIKVKAEALFTIAKAVVMLAGSLVVLAMIPAENLTRGILVISLLVENLVRIMKTLGKVSKSTSSVSSPKEGIAAFLQNLGDGALSIGAQLLLMAGAVGILTAALGILGTMQYETLTKGLVMVVTLITVLAQEAKNIAKLGKNGPKAAGTIMALAFAVNVLIAPILLLGAIMTKTETGTQVVLAGAMAVAGMLLAVTGMVTAIMEAVNKFGQGFGMQKAKAISMIMGVMILMIGTIGVNLALLTVAVSNLQVDTEYFTAKSGGTNGLAMAVKVVIDVLAGILGFIVGFLWAAKKFTFTDDQVRKMKSLTLTMVAVVAAISGLLIALTLATGELDVTFKSSGGNGASLKGGGTSRMESASKAITEILVGMAVFLGAMIVAMSKIKSKAGSKGKKTSGWVEDLKGIAIFIAAASVAIWAISEAITRMATKVDMKKAWGALGIITAVIALITLLAGAAGAMPFIATGMDVLAKTFLLFGVASVAFAAAVWVIVNAFEELANSSKKHIKAFGENSRLLADELAATAPHWSLVIGSFIASVVLAIASGLAEGWLNIAKVFLDGVDQTLIALNQYAPSIVSNLVDVIWTVIDELEPELGTIIPKVIEFAVKLIEALAKGIEENRSKILEAIDKLLLAIANLVAEAVSKLFGMSKEQTQKFVGWFGPVIRMVGRWIAAAFAVKAIVNFIRALKGLKNIAFISGIKTLISDIGVFKNALKASKGGFGGFTQALINTGTAGEGAFAKLSGGIGKILGTLGGKGTIAVGLGSLAIVAASKFKIYVDNMNTIGDAAQLVEDAQDDIKKSAQEAYDTATREVQEFRDELEKIPQSVNSESIDTASYLDKLKEVFGGDGKVKPGMEDMAYDLLPEINSELSTKFDIVNNTLTLEGNSLTTYEEMSSALEDVNKQLQLKRTLEAYGDKATEADKRLTELPGEIKDARKAYEDAKAEYYDIWQESAEVDTLKDDNIRKDYLLFYKQFGGDQDKIKKEFISWYNDRTKMLKRYGAEIGKTAETAYLNVRDGLDLSFGDVVKTKWDTLVKNAAAAEEAAQKAAEVAKETYEGLESDYSYYSNVLDSYSEFETAFMEGDTAAAEEAMRRLQHGVGEVSELTANELEDRLINARDNYDEMLRLAKEHNTNINRETADSLAWELRTYSKAYALRMKLTGKDGMQIGPFKFKTSDALISDTEKMIDEMYKHVSDSAAKTEEKVEETNVDMISSIRDSIKSSGLKEKDVLDFFGVKSMSSLSKDQLKVFGNFDFDKIAEEMYDGSRVVGTNGSLGFLDGNTEGFQGLDGIVDDQLGENGYLGQCKKVLGIASPSKKMYQIGIWAVQGFVNGINSLMKGKDSPMAAAAAMVNTALNAAKIAILSGGNDMALKPIVDLSAIQNGSAQTLLNGKNLALTSEMSSQISASIKSAEFEEEMRRIGEQLMAIRTDMFNIGSQTNRNLITLGNNINGMKVVMNTGALVGQIAAPMDRALGVRTSLARRGL